MSSLSECTWTKPNAIDSVNSTKNPWFVVCVIMASKVLSVLTQRWKNSMSFILFIMLKEVSYETSFFVFRFATEAHSRLKDGFLGRSVQKHYPSARKRVFVARASPVLASSHAGSKPAIMEKVFTIRERLFSLLRSKISSYSRSENRRKSRGSRQKTSEARLSVAKQRPRRGATGCVCNRASMMPESVSLVVDLFYKKSRSFERLM